MKTKRPVNIVYVLADDLGYGDVSCLNPDSKIQTPNHDRVAREGMTFTDAHSNSAVCTPTRYGVLTGRYAWRTRLKSGVLWGYSPPLIEEGRETVASLLSSAGYRTACIGKWHLGLGWQSDRELTDAMSETHDGIDFSAPLTAGPHTVGFDYSYIHPASLDMAPYCLIENGQVVEQPTACIEAQPSGNGFWREGPISPGFQHENCLLELTRRATGFIADHAREKSDQPFFLYFPTTSPHHPHVPRKPFHGKSDAGVYGDFVNEHDWSLGQLLDTLDRHGLADDTLVIVTSDNGAHAKGDAFDYERDFDHRSNHIYRGQKSDAWDGGHRVPFLVRWPGRVRAGGTCDTAVCLTDLMATAAELTDTKLAADVGPDSVSLMPLLESRPEDYGRDSLVHHSISGEFAIRRGKWKLVCCRGSGGWSLPDDKVSADAEPMQLYDMAADPGETDNLFSRETSRVQQLLDELKQCQASAAQA